MIQRFYRPARLVSVATALFFLFFWFAYLRDVSFECSQPVALRNFNESRLLELQRQEDQRQQQLSQQEQEEKASNGEQEPQNIRRSKIAKITVATNKLDTPIVERALRSHKTQNDIHGYIHHIAANQVVNSIIENDQKHRAQGAWTKPAYIMSIIVAELQKPKEEQLEWVFWFDADTIVTNPLTPLEIFLPPPSNPDLFSVNLLMASNWDGLNSGAFALRVHPWSVSLLSAVLAYPIYKAENLEKDRFRDQSAFQWLLTKDESPLAASSHLKGREYWAEVPMRWFNSLPFNNAFNKSGHWLLADKMTNETFDNGTTRVYNDGKGGEVMRWKVMQGDMIVHFAGSERVRDSWMSPWLDRAEALLPEWANSTTQNRLREEAKDFWDKTAHRIAQAKMNIQVVTVVAPAPAPPLPPPTAVALTPPAAETTAAATAAAATTASPGSVARAVVGPGAGAGIRMQNEAPPVMLRPSRKYDWPNWPSQAAEPDTLLVDTAPPPPPRIAR